MRIALVVDKSPAYLGFQRDRLLSSWGVMPDETRRISNILDGGKSSLFGGAPLSLLSITDDSSLKDAAEAISKVKHEDFAATHEAGLIVTCSCDRTKTKKLEAFFTKLGAQVMLPAKGGDAPVAMKLIDGIGLRREVRDWLVSYIGNDLDAALPIVETLASIPPAQAARITEEDLYVRMPQQPGSVPPWDIEEPLFAGNIPLAIELSRRINAHSSFLVWLSVFKKKIVNMNRVAQLLAINPRMSDAELTSILGLPQKGFYFVKKRATALPQAELQRAVDAIIRAEGAVKGDSGAPALAIIDALVVELCMILGRKGGRR